MSYSSRILGVGLALSFGVLNAILFERAERKSDA